MLLNYIKSDEYRSKLQLLSLSSISSNKKFQHGTWPSCWAGKTCTILTWSSRSLSNSSWLLKYSGVWYWHPATPHGLGAGGDITVLLALGQWPSETTSLQSSVSLAISLIDPTGKPNDQASSLPWEHRKVLRSSRERSNKAFWLSRCSIQYEKEIQMNTYSYTQ